MGAIADKKIAQSAARLCNATSEVVRDVWVFLKRRDASMSCGTHVLEITLVFIPPALHVRLLLQSCDDDHDWYLLPTDPSVKRVIGSSDGGKGSRSG